MRRRFSCSSTLRRMTTLSATNSSTPKRLIPSWSWARSAVITDVTPISLIAAATSNSCLRTPPESAKRLKIASRESIESSFGPDAVDCVVDARDERAEVVGPDHHLLVRLSSEASTKAHLPISSQARDVEAE